MEKQTQPSNKFGQWIKNSITARLVMVGILTLALLIPLSFIESLIRERSLTQQEVINEINQKWGEEVLLYGPVLKIPYKTFKEKIIADEKTKQVYTESIEEIKYAYFFPDDLKISSTINPEQRKRSIYKTAVYNSSIKINGSFSKPDFKELDIKEQHIMYDKAKIVLQTSNLKGVNSHIQIKLQNDDYSFTSKYNNSYKKHITMHTLESNVINKSDLPLSKKTNFTLNLAINGSKQISFVPVGKQTEATINSNWKAPNFFGEFLPYNKDKINANGFNAKWKILDINRPFSQNHFNYFPDLTKYAFGVNFMIPVDQYQQSERSAKYGFLVIGLTFLIFFLIQTLSKINIHPFQYLMIGLALTMFYTLLISISEHSSFLKAYIIAGLAVISLITFYSKSILKSIKFTSFIGLSLLVLYSFIYIIIQLESYALLVGSIGLFIILGIIMLISRKIEWN